MTSIDQAGPQLTTGVKGDWTGLYRRFLQTVNFESWFQLRLLEANKKLVALHMEALSQSVRLYYTTFIALEYLRFPNGMRIPSVEAKHK